MADISDSPAALATAPITPVSEGNAATASATVEADLKTRTRRGMPRASEFTASPGEIPAPPSTSTVAPPPSAPATAPPPSAPATAPPPSAPATAPPPSAPATAPPPSAPATAPPPSAPATAPPPSAPATAPPPSFATGRTHHADPSSVHRAGGIYTPDYDTMTLADLTTKYLQQLTRQQVEALMVTHLEAAPQQEESKRVEKFIDVSLAGLASLSTLGKQRRKEQQQHDDEDGSDDEHEEGYTYNEMLTRLYEQLNRNHEGSAMMERNQVPVPILEKIGKKKTVISNFGRICNAFRRPVEDVKDYIEKELAIRSNLDSNNALIMKYQTDKATDFDRIIIKYLDMYVKCNSCYRIDTTLTKGGRRLELRCNWCTATRTVAAASMVTFSALVEKRSKQRAAMTL